MSKLTFRLSQAIPEELDLGLCPLSGGSLPFEANTDFGIIMIDELGIYFKPNNISAVYCQEFPVDLNLARFIVSGLEVLNQDQIPLWIENFKKNSTLVNL